MLYRGFATQAEIDREYDVETMVPDFRPYAQHFIEESARARAELTARLDLRFGPTRDEYLDFFPADRAPAALLVFIHGGYWRMLSAKEFSLVARGPVARGMAVAVTNYSLCPKVTIAEITRQSRAALAWLHRHAHDLGVDPERIVVAGHSAGGQQVGMVVGTDWVRDYGLPATTLRGGMSISGLFDLEPLRFSWLQPALQLDLDMVRRESPIHNIPARAPPQVVTLGGDESGEFHRQSRDYLAAWQAAGLQGRMLDQPGCNHFTAIDGFLDPDHPLTQSALDLAGSGAQKSAPAKLSTARRRFPTYGPVV
jgi:arylformamidase